MREHPGLERSVEAHKEIPFGADRSAAMLAAAAVGHYLRAAILLQLPNRDDDTSEKLTGEGGPIASFFGNIHLAFAMGLINATERDDLNIIRKIRNAFAHSMGQVLFAMPEIQRECENLKTVADYRGPMLDPSQLAPPARQRFVAVADCVGWALLSKIAEQLDASDAIAE